VPFLEMRENVLGKSEGKRLGREKMIFKRIFKRYGVKLYTGVLRLRMESSGGFLCQSNEL
jgi:hypothetical protein